MKILENTSLFFIVAIIIGLVYPNFSEFTGQYIVLFFMIATTLSLTHMKLAQGDVKKNAGPSLKAVALSYGLLSGSILICAYLLVPNPDYLAGFIIMAAVPPAVVVIPFTYLLKGDAKATLGGEVLNYMFALALAPLITLILIGSAVDVFEIMKILFLIIILPLILSRLLIRHPHSSDSLQKIIVNFCFGFINYSVIGLNQATIMSDPVALWPILLVNFLTVFVPGTLIYFTAEKFGASKERRMSYTLFSSIKNGGMAATLAIILLTPAASLPGALHGPFTIGFFIILEFLSRRRN